MDSSRDVGSLTELEAPEPEHPEHFGEPMWLLAARVSMVVAPGQTAHSTMLGYRTRATEAEACESFLQSVRKNKPGFTVEDLLCMQVPPVELRHSLGLPEPLPPAATPAEPVSPPTLLSISRAVVGAWRTGRIEADDRGEDVPEGDLALSGLSDVGRRLQGNAAPNAADNQALLTAAGTVVAGWDAGRIKAAAGAPRVALQALKQSVALHKMVLDEAPQGNAPGIR